MAEEAALAALQGQSVVAQGEQARKLLDAAAAGDLASSAAIGSLRRRGMPCPDFWVGQLPPS